MTRKSALGSNPLDAIIPKQPATAPKSSAKKPVEKKQPPERDRITVQILASTVERLKDCAYWERLTVAEIVEQGALALIEKMEAKRGEKYPTRAAPLKAGRPLKR